MVLKGVEVSQFSHLQIPNVALDDPVVFLSVGRIPDAMLQLVSGLNQLLIQYKAALHLTFSVPIPKKVTFKVIEGITKDSPIVKRKVSSKSKIINDIGVSNSRVKENNKSKLKSQGVVIKEVNPDEVQQNKKRKATSVLIKFKKLRAQTAEDLSTTTNPIEGDKDREEPDEEVIETDDLIFNASPRKDANQIPRRQATRM
ncbi:unnamed protein product [Lactuca saligna]|uniref:Uncharacterized protein n=1 Tax=Lactuca saligna TaxID=75948 RepID=A0AA36EH73_LACSI|nr:unnamed protein product [Lactuca saligna]